MEVNKTAMASMVATILSMPKAAFVGSPPVQAQVDQVKSMMESQIAQQAPQAGLAPPQPAPATVTLDQLAGMVDQCLQQTGAIGQMVQQMAATQAAPPAPAPAPAASGGGEGGGEAKKPSPAERMDAIEQQLTQIQQTLSGGAPPAPGGVAGAPAPAAPPPGDPAAAAAAGGAPPPGMAPAPGMAPPM